MITTLLKRILLAAYLIAALLPITTTAADKVAVSPVNPSGFIIHRGTNLSHWLSQDFGWHSKDAWLTQNDIRFIASEGFDHVRLPVDETELWNGDGTKNAAAFARLRQGVDWCRDAHLRIIVDVHTMRSHHFNASNEGLKNTLFTDPKAQAHLASLWKDLSACIGDIPNSELAYEIMNEPVADNPEDWNHLVAITIKSIRQIEPKRVIVVGANRWQIPQSFPFLKVPAGDKNIILSFHTYSPMLFTHYKANWTGLRGYTGPVNYPGQVAKTEGNEQLEELAKNEGVAQFVKQANEVWNANRIYKEIEPAVLRAKELGLQLYCGEFGCMPTVPRAARLAYYHDIASVFEAHSVAWSNWEYKGDFGIFEWHGEKETIGAPDVEMIDALMLRNCCKTDVTDKPVCAR
jgi:endoglucanase